MRARIPERLQHGRLAYERIEADHAVELGPLLLDPRVWGNLQTPGKPPPTLADVRTNAEHKHAHWERHGFGMWLVRDGPGGPVVGRGGLQYTDATGTREVEIGWAILPERWGEGLATELAHTAVEAALGALALETVIAYTLPANLASRRVMERPASSTSARSSTWASRTSCTGAAPVRADAATINIWGGPTPIAGVRAAADAGARLRTAYRRAPLTRSREARKEHR